MKENRKKRTINIAEEQKITSPNNKQLNMMIKEMIKAMKEYEKATRKEIENIMKIVNLKFSKKEKEQEQITKICYQMKEKLIQA